MIKKLKPDNNLTGDDVGRMMILDLVESYKNLISGNGEKGLYTSAQKVSMVNALTKPDDIRRYNEYKYIHDFLNVAPAIYESYAKTYEVYYWRAYYMIKELMEAEEDYRRPRPLIMTKKQYAEWKRSGAPDMPRVFGGIAVLEPEFYPLDDISDDDRYVEPPARWKSNLAESFISKNGAQLRECLGGIKNMLRECLARQAAVELVGNFINIPDVVLLLNPVDTYEVSQLSGMMVSVTDGLERRGILEGEQGAAELKKELKALLVPIDVKSLAPTNKATEKAAAKLDFSTAQGNMEAFIAMLKRGGDNE